MSEDMKVILENFSKFKDFFKQREEERAKELHRRREEEKRKEEEEKRKKEEERIAFYRKRGPKFEFRPHRSMRYSAEKDGKIYLLTIIAGMDHYPHDGYTQPSFTYNGHPVDGFTGHIEKALAGKKQLRSYLQGFKDRVEKNNFPKTRRYQEMLPHAKEAIPAVEELLNSGLLDLTGKEKEFENRPPPSREELIEEIEGILFTNDPEDREQVEPAAREYARFLVDRRLLTQILKYLKSKQ